MQPYSSIATQLSAPQSTAHKAITVETAWRWEWERVLKYAERWAEVPGDHHAVSANNSGTEPARLLAVFVVDTDETNLVRNDK
ncbi:cupin 2 conserved barrel domain protein [Tolypothrix tenuis PCC 7101]|uniref:Cupin 2 conserved barrel domain protein n=1 Tax=Tolypothrix tenuis PCC 7101 TaxID=231146 RepID=A0A1Z4N260_9CYAN|nr:cupin 2 conserved barrel domain protein [Tolypothrix tenuis PCC 7101]BAZ76271.1 cupin 2 conserved barrel domain protein [Aulosira laxa NIES-50]